MIRASLVVWLLLGLGFGAGAVAEPVDDYCRKRQLLGEEAGLTSYEKRQKYGMNGMYVYIKDEGIWTYTPWFRAFFGMPCGWVDPELQGAEGVALYFSRTARKRCHRRQDGSTECVPSRQLHLDLYLSAGTELGWSGDYLYNSRPYLTSLTELADRRPELRQRWEELFDLDHVYLYLEWPDGRRRELEAGPLSYHKESKGRLVQVNLAPDPEILVASPEAIRVVEFEDGAGTVLHRVELSRAFSDQLVGYPRRFPELNRDNWLGGEQRADYHWVCTRDFAEEFGLPEHYISDELTGARAIAFRMGHYGWIDCGFFGAGDDPDSCVEATKTRFEFYLPPEAKIRYRNSNFLWKNYHTTYSGVFLQLEDPRYRKSAWYYEEQNSGPKSLIHVERQRVERLRIFSEKKFAFGSLASAHVKDFYRPGTLSESFGYYTVPDLMHLDGEEMYLLFTDSISIPPMNQELWDRDYHRVRLPRAFRRAAIRLTEKYERGHGSLWQLVSERLGFN